MDNDQLLINQYLTNHPHLATDAIERLPIEEVALLIEHLELAKSSIILTNLTVYKAGKILEKVPRDRAVNLFEALKMEVSEAILRVVNQSFRSEILEILPEELSSNLKTALSFNTKQIGAHIAADLLTLSEDWTIEKALSEIKIGWENAKPVLFVLGQDKKLTGYVKVNELITSNPNKLTQSVTMPISNPLIANMGVKDALENWDERFTELPVVKGDGRFLGSVSRVELLQLKVSSKSNRGKLEIRSGNALGDLYLIGLSSLLGSPEPPSDNLT